MLHTTTKDTYNLTNYKLKELSVEVVDNYNNKNSKISIDFMCNIKPDFCG